MGRATRTGAAATRPDRPHGEGEAGHAAATRLGSLDALRGAAMLLVVVAHVALAYTEVRIPRLLWVIRDPIRSAGFDALFWASVGSAMPAFFLLSGFFAVRIHEAHGAAGFARDRYARRILAPFLVGGAVILPLTLTVWGAGWMRCGRCTWPQFVRMSFLDPVIEANNFGPAHLWYLEYLVLMLAVFGLLRSRREPGQAEPPRNWLLHPLAPLALAVPSALILWAGHLRFGLDAVTDARNSFVPDPFRWAHHGWYFLVGTWLYRRRDALSRFVPHWPWRLALAAGVFLVRFQLVERDLVVPLQGSPGLLLAASGALFGWLALFGGIGLFQRVFERPRPAVRYLADSSYWIYLIHMPILGLAQVGLYGTAAPAPWKFAAVLAVTLGLGLASYEVTVRHTWIGLWLHGARPLPARLSTPRRHSGPDREGRQARESSAKAG